MIETQSLAGMTLLVTVSGPADRNAARDVQRAILGGIDGGHVRAIVDLSEVADVQPGLLGVLLRLRRRLLGMGGALSVLSPVPVGELFGVPAAEEILPRMTTLPPPTVPSA